MPHESGVGRPPYWLMTRGIQYTTPAKCTTPVTSPRRIASITDGARTTATSSGTSETQATNGWPTSGKLRTSRMPETTASITCVNKCLADHDRRELVFCFDTLANTVSLSTSRIRTHPDAVERDRCVGVRL